MAATTIIWLRRDLRLADNPALASALADAERLVPLYIHAPREEAPWQPGAASRWWLHHSLTALDRSLRSLGTRLVVARADDSLSTLRRVIAASGATRVCWNRCYEPAAVVRDRAITRALREDGVQCESRNGTLLFEPWDLATDDGTPYRVFSAFWRRASKALSAHPVEHPPARLPPLPAGLDHHDIADLELLPSIRWDTGLAQSWTPCEAGAQQRAQAFLEGAITDYEARRDPPAVGGTSRLSPHLHFGEIGPRQILHQIADRGLALSESPAEPFVRELGWREFAYHLLYHFPHTPDDPLDERFAAFPWRSDDGKRLDAWQRGRTGVPLVDAGLRELWETGWMHNRVRMVVASYLTKNLRLPWQSGARWFWDTLVDADLANNTLGWQWTAGCGADAAPYFRVFNPVRQAERFDADGAYIRRWCPELARLPTRYLSQAWTAPKEVLAEAKIQLGRDYPQPLVDLAESRRDALAAWEKIKGER